MTHIFAIEFNESPDYHDPNNYRFLGISRVQTALRQRCALFHSCSGAYNYSMFHYFESYKKFAVLKHTKKVRKSSETVRFHYLRNVQYGYHHYWEQNPHHCWTSFHWTIKPKIWVVSILTISTPIWCWTTHVPFEKFAKRFTGF